MPILKEFRSADLNWNFDFAPRKNWPGFLPAVGVIYNEKTVIVGGFSLKKDAIISVVIVEKSIEEALVALYPPETLAPLENLRLNAKLNFKIPQTYLLDLSLGLQEFFDERAIPLKILKPLQHLSSWISEITKAFLALRPTSSQVREILDLLCDLKYQEKDWILPEEDVSKWMAALKAQRFPNTSQYDQLAKVSVDKVSWPRGVRAVWERSGDQAGILLQTKVSNFREWKNLRENLSKLEIGEDFWIP